MTTEHRKTVIAVSKFCNKLHRTILFERQGYRPQVHVETLIFTPGHDDSRVKDVVVLRVPQAVEVAQALLAAVETYYTSAPDERPLTAEVQS